MPDKDVFDWNASMHAWNDPTFLEDLKTKGLHYQSQMHLKKDLQKKGITQLMEQDHFVVL